MTGYASALGSEYDAFLYAPLYRDQHDIVLSVVSVLARLDVDPWGEAAKLAGLPKTTATTQLAALISRVPGGLPRLLDAKATASRLVALLPSSAGPALSLSMKAAGIGARFQARILFFLLVVLIGFGLHYFIAGRADRVATDPGGAVESSPSVEQ